MPSLQTALPPELANNVIRLYRTCLRRAYLISQKGHTTEVFVGFVRQRFREHKNETDPEKIQELKDNAARILIKTEIFLPEKMNGLKSTLY